MSESTELNDGYRSSEDEDYVPEEGASDGKIKKKKAKKSETAPFGTRFTRPSLQNSLNENIEENVVIVKKEEKKEKKVGKDSGFDLNAVLKEKRRKALEASKAKKKKSVPFKMPGMGKSLTKTSNEAKPSEVATKKKETVAITKELDFAGESIKVEKEVTKGSAEERRHNAEIASRGTALSSIMGMIDKKSSLSTLNKSKMDWNTYKEMEGFEVSHKDSVLEDQEFLHRVEHRVYEKEKGVNKGRK
eukprot:m.18623 g.18623  ORF g.18623 m.18623 type:complete len:246 (-) comp4988_c0_seq1:876-1613(-)